jgi:hypothetical protein
MNITQNQKIQRHRALIFLLSLMLYCSGGIALENQAIKGIPPIDLYSARIPVASQTAIEVPKALNAALKQVLIKVSQDPTVLSDNPHIQHALANPGSLMKQFDYISVPVTESPSGMMLHVVFDNAMINQLLQKIHKNNLPPQSNNENKDFDNSQVNLIKVEIHSIKNFNDYTQALNSLKTIEGIQDLSIDRAQSDILYVTLHMAGGVNALQNALISQNKFKIQGHPSNARFSIKWSS